MSENGEIYTADKNYTLPSANCQIPPLSSAWLYMMRCSETTAHVHKDVNFFHGFIYFHDLVDAPHFSMLAKLLVMISGVVNIVITNITDIVITNIIINITKIITTNITNIITINISSIIIKGGERKPSCDNPKRGYCDDQPDNGTTGDFENKFECFGILVVFPQ